LQYLDLSFSRSKNNTELEMYRKPTYTDIMIHYTSKHPQNHKLAAFIFYINRKISMPITCQAINRERQKILTVARNNGFPEHIIHELKKNLSQTKQRSHKQPHLKNKVINGSLLLSTALLYTALKIAFHPTNTSFKQLTQKPQRHRST